MELYKDFTVEHFDTKPPPYTTTYAVDHSSVDSTPSVEDDVITGETVAKLLSKVRFVLVDGQD